MLTSSDTPIRKKPNGTDFDLERQLIAEYLLSKGYRMPDLKKLPDDQKKALMREACLHAALKLAAIEAKSKFRQEIKPP